MIEGARQEENSEQTVERQEEEETTIWWEKRSFFFFGLMHGQELGYRVCIQKHGSVAASVHVLFIAMCFFSFFSIFFINEKGILQRHLYRGHPYRHLSPYL